jgi:hypothetical protein
VGYSLDGKENVAINQEVLFQHSLTPYAKAWTGNLTLIGLCSGSHSLVVYAKDQFGQTGASITKEFMVEESMVAKETQAETGPFPTMLIVAITVMVVVGIGLLVFFVTIRKRTPRAEKHALPNSDFTSATET